MENKIVSKVWNMHGMLVAATPGLLVFENGIVSFITEQEQEFEVPLNELKKIKWPFLQFGYGFNTVVNNKKYKFTFMKPNSAPNLDDSTVNSLYRMTRVGRGIEALAALTHIGENKKTAKQWKQLVAY